MLPLLLAAQLVTAVPIPLLGNSAAQTVSVASGDLTVCWQGVCRTVRELFDAVKPEPTPWPCAASFESLTDGLPPAEFVQPQSSGKRRTPKP